MFTTFHVEDSVKTKNTIPELELQKGSIGVIRSIWSQDAYEVEFIEPHIRGLILAEQLEQLYG